MFPRDVPRRSPRRALALGVPLAILAACGARSEIEGAPARASASGGAATTSLSTSAGSTTSSMSTGGGGAAGACPTIAPNPGDPCSSDGTTCTYDSLCCAAPAVCVSGHWSVTVPMCNGVCRSCPGTVGCSGSALCVDNPQGGGATIAKPHYTCVPNPCGGQTPSCACAASVCDGPCGSVNGYTVECVDVMQ